MNNPTKTIITNLNNQTQQNQQSIIPQQQTIMPSRQYELTDRLYNEVFLPTIKNLITSMLHNAINIIFNTNSYTPMQYSNVVNYNTSSYTNYNKQPYGYTVYNYNQQQTMPQSQQQNIQTNSTYAVNYIPFNSEGEAQALLLSLKEIISTQGFARVSDYYNLRNMQSDFTCVNYGWYDLNNCRVENKGNGYFITFPRIQIIK